jgi:hypothetical protein
MKVKEDRAVTPQTCYMVQELLLNLIQYYNAQAAIQAMHLKYANKKRVAVFMDSSLFLCT